LILGDFGVVAVGQERREISISEVSQDYSWGLEMAEDCLTHE